RGPWLTRWNGEWAIDLRLAGGMPRSRKTMLDENRRAMVALQENRKRNDDELVKNERFIERYLTLTQAYDNAAAAFRQTVKQYPGVARNELPEAL
ncbi:hypothetical protein SB761_28295, partial [Pseudomonas sp. SIMBA_064]